MSETISRPWASKAQGRSARFLPGPGHPPSRGLNQAERPWAFEAQGQLQVLAFFDDHDTVMIPAVKD